MNTQERHEFMRQLQGIGVSFETVKSLAGIGGRGISFEQLCEVEKTKQNMDLNSAILDIEKSRNYFYSMFNPGGVTFANRER